MSVESIKSKRNEWQGLTWSLSGLIKNSPSSQESGLIKNTPLSQEGGHVTGRGVDSRFEPWVRVRRWTVCINYSGLDDRVRQNGLSMVMW
jgi:hypothetical protein